MQSLDSDQVKAVTVKGHAMCLAGAGAGKTRVLIFRLQKLLDDMFVSCTEPEGQVLCMSFSKKATSEMRERLASLIDHGVLRDLRNRGLLSLGTFHSFCAKFLRYHTAEQGMLEGRRNSFTITDEAVQKKIIRSLIKDIGFARLNDSDLYYTEDGKPNPSAFLDNYMFKKGRSAEWVVGKNAAEQYLIDGYENIMRINNSVDFADLINIVVRFLDANPEARPSYKHVIIDEFQDTSTVQYRLMELVSERATIFCVGDLDQSLYEWRSAAPKNIMVFIKKYQASVCLIESNYRSMPAIVSGANSMIQYNQMRPEKVMRATRGGNRGIVMAEPKNFHEEARMVALHAAAMYKRKKTCAILYRSNTQVRVIENALISRGIPHVILKDAGFMKRREISAAMNLLKYIRNPLETQSFHMSIEHFVKGISMQKATDICEQLRNGYSFEAGEAANTELLGEAFTACAATMEGVKLNKPTAARLGEFLTIIGTLTGDEPLNGLTQTERVVSWMKNSPSVYVALTKMAGDDEPAFDNRVQNINVLFGMMLKHKKIEDFLDAISLDVSNEDDASAYVQLMTIHASKGLEFDEVLLVGATESSFTSRVETDNEYEEARRIMYVAMTRAKERLIISSPEKHVSLIHEGRERPEQPCHFLSEIPEKYMPVRPSNENSYGHLNRYGHELRIEPDIACVNHHSHPY